MIETVRKIIDEQIKDFGISDMKIGTVISEKPLKIRLNERIVLNENQILLTEFVLEKKIKLIHHHKAITGKFIVKQETEADKIHLVRGITEDELSKGCIIQEGLKSGDKVIMISAEREQKYIVLSKLREKKKVIIDGITSEWSWS